MTRLFLVAAVILALTVPTVAKAGSVCTFAKFSRGRTFAKLTGDPGGDSALYVYIDGELVTWFSTQDRWFYVTSRKNVAVYGYDSADNLECGG